MAKFQVWADVLTKDGPVAHDGREIEASTAAVAAKTFADRMGVRRTRHYGDQAAPVRLAVGEGITIQVRRVS